MTSKLEQVEGKVIICWLLFLICAYIFFLNVIIYLFALSSLQTAQQERIIHSSHAVAQCVRVRVCVRILQMNSLSVLQN